MIEFIYSFVFFEFLLYTAYEQNVYFPCVIQTCHLTKKNGSLENELTLSKLI